MAATDEAVAVETVERIGKIGMTIGKPDSCADQARTGREQRVEALTRWLLAQWRLEHGEARN
jgi:hypothetical protein